MTVLAAGCGTALALAQPLHHDVAWTLWGARAMLGRAELYTDVIEIGPPLIYWLSVPAVLLERAGVPLGRAYILLVALTAASSLVACHRLATRVISERVQEVFLTALAVAFFLAPGAAWGQREHLTVLLTAPYIVARAARTGRALPIGIAAGIGFALKPHFLIAFVAVETWALATRRRRWSASVLAAATIAAYGIAVLVFVPQYLPAALDLAPIYAGFVGQALPEIAADPRALLSAVALLAAVVPGDGQALRQAFAVATLGWLAALLLQGKGFDYHYLPALLGAVVLVPLAVPRFAMRVAAAIGIVFVIAAGNPAADPRWPQIREFDHLADGAPVLVLSPNVHDIWPHTLYAGAVWTAPIPAMWPTVSTHPDALARTVAWIVPALDAGVRVLVPVPRDADLPDPFEVALPALLRDSTFRDVWRSYAETESGSYYLVFRHARAR